MDRHIYVGMGYRVWCGARTYSEQSETYDADLIADLVSTGTTLRDNQLRMLSDGLILESQACLIANRRVLKARPVAQARGEQ